MQATEESVLALFGLTALNWTIHWYTQMVTYRLFANVAGVSDGAGFVAYHRAYQSRLVWAIYIPWSLLMLASIAVVATASPATVAGAWLLLLLNASIGAISVAFAAPVHARIDRANRLDPQDATALLRSNLIRLGVASVSLAICTVLAFDILLGVG